MGMVNVLKAVNGEAGALPSGMPSVGRPSVGKCWGLSEYAEHVKDAAGSLDFSNFFDRVAYIALMGPVVDAVTWVVNVSTRFAPVAPALSQKAKYSFHMHGR